ncbi:MAG: aspartate aminotransferase family protein [Saprospiraceae bacterium]|nr:aspartate aminotransferase family protein [Saprospiraceae bacterium]
MNTENSIQEAMFREMREKSIFEQAQQYALQYLEQVYDRNVFPTEKALLDLNHFEEGMPEASTDAASVISLLNQYGSPATTTILGGRYFGFVNGSAVPAGLAAKNLATYWDQNTAMQVISPISAKLESVVENWLKELFGLPGRTVAGFVSGTSSANFCGLAAARYRLLKRMGWDINEQGLFDAPKIRVVAGKQAHSTILKAIGLLGFGKNNVEWVESDEQGRIRPDLIPDLDDKTLLILQAGNVNSGSFDAFDEICERANQAGAWVHIDGAFGLWAEAVESLKYLTKGIHKANSWAVDGHKTLNTPYDCGIVLCEDKEAMVAALHMSGSYIILSEERDGMLYTPEMSRRARIIELWATMKYLGKAGIARMVENMHDRSVQFANAVRAIKGFEVLNEVVFNQVLVCCASDEITVKTMERIQALRECWVGGSSWHGRKVIRVSICSWATTPEDVRRSVASFEQALKEVSGETR